MKEIDLRALVVDRLTWKSQDIKPYNLSNNNQDHLKERPFETFSRWTVKEQTSYIESIFLKCSLQPIIRFINDKEDHTIIVDGFNRYMAIYDFCHNKLALSEKGLKQLKFLANKKFNNLSEDEMEYFKKCDPIKMIDYHYTSEEIPLNQEEEKEIVRYLHMIYNIGLKLEIEELQRAQFSNDFITNQIREKIENDPLFFDMLKSLKQCKISKNSERKKIDNTLLNCRLLIASTYSNIHYFTSMQSKQERIEENYLPNLKGLDLNKVFHDFILNINILYENLILTQKWSKYPILHTKGFIDATYWLLSIIRKDNLGDPLGFDLIKYLEYFGSKEEENRIFVAKNSHQRKNIYKTYEAVAQYYEQEYGQSLKQHFVSDIKHPINTTLINDIKELHHKHFSFSPYKVNAGSLLDELQTSKYSLRPHYQREEAMKIDLSSKIIQSMLLGFAIPYLLLYDRYENGKIITEVVDGQQRILSILSYFDQPFLNESGEMEYSCKSGYSLKDLEILTEYNGKKIKTEDPNKKLPTIKQKNILETELYISKTTDNQNSNFSAVDHFIRLNKNSFTIKPNSYRLWHLTADTQILNYETQITNKFLGTILPKSNKYRTSNTTTLKLACLFYYQKDKKINISDYRVQKVSLWLKDFTKYKNMYIHKENEKISLLRQKYFDAFDQVNDLYRKINDFINYCNISIRELLFLEKWANISSINYYYLFTMLHSISKEELIENSDKILPLLHSFFEKYKEFKENNKPMDHDYLDYITQQISIYDSNRKYEFREKLGPYIH